MMQNNQIEPWSNHQICNVNDYLKKVSIRIEEKKDIPLKNHRNNRAMLVNKKKNKFNQQELSFFGNFSIFQNQVRSKLEEECKIMKKSGLPSKGNQIGNQNFHDSERIKEIFKGFSWKKTSKIFVKKEEQKQENSSPFFNFTSSPNRKLYTNPSLDIQKLQKNKLKKYSFSQFLTIQKETSSSHQKVDKTPTKRHNSTSLQGQMFAKKGNINSLKLNSSCLTNYRQIIPQPKKDIRCHTEKVKSKSLVSRNNLFQWIKFVTKKGLSQVKITGKFKN